MRRFPAPWTIEPLDAGYKVVDANGQVLAYVYGLDDSRDARIAKSLTRDHRAREPSSLRSWSVRSGKTDKSIRFRSKLSAYSDSPSEPSHSLTGCIAAPRGFAADSFFLGPIGP